MTGCNIMSLYFIIFVLQSFGNAFLGIPSFLEYGTCPTIPSYPYLNPQKGIGVKPWYELTAPADLLSSGQFKHQPHITSLTVRLNGLLWYMHEAVPNEYVDTRACDNTYFSWNNQDQFLTINTKGLDDDGQKVKEVTGSHLDKASTNKNFIFLIKKEGMPVAPYVFIDTNYKDYLCSYSCLNYYGFRALFAWTFTREPKPNQKHIQNCHKALTKYGIDDSILKPRVQGEICPYWKKLDAIGKHTQTKEVPEQESLITHSSITMTEVPEQQRLESVSGNSLKVIPARLILVLTSLLYGISLKFIKV